jgi:hypothetical protein
MKSHLQMLEVVGQGRVYLQHLHHKSSASGSQTLQALGPSKNPVTSTC